MFSIMCATHLANPQNRESAWGDRQWCRCSDHWPAWTSRRGCRSHSASPHPSASALELSQNETSPLSHCPASALSDAAVAVAVAGAAPVGDDDVMMEVDGRYPSQRQNCCSAVSQSDCSYSEPSSGLVGRLKVNEANLHQSASTSWSGKHTVWETTLMTAHIPWVFLVSYQVCWPVYQIPS